MQKLSDLDVTLSVIGDGPDLEELRRRCQAFGSRVTFHPAVRQDDIPRMLMGHDVLVFPTRYEGLPATLLEAMAAGCVPVCSKLRGITDYVVTAEKSGFLFPVDDPAAAAGHIRKLAEDRQLLRRCSDAAIEEVRIRFDCLTAGTVWQKLFSDLRQNPPFVAPPLDIRRWNYPRAFSRGLRAYVPERVKNVLRAWKAR